MLFGDKSKFAIEISINNVFGDKHVGEGCFLVFINFQEYGLKKKYATTFLCIADQLIDFYKNKKNSNLYLENETKELIANYYYIQNFTDNNINEENIELSSKIKNLIEWSPESAFDDGSHLIHFDDGEQTRIIGFKSCKKRSNFCVREKSICEIVIPRILFTETIYSAYSYLQSFVKEERKQ